MAHESANSNGTRHSVDLRELDSELLAHLRGAGEAELGSLREANTALTTSAAEARRAGDADLPEELRDRVRERVIAAAGAAEQERPAPSARVVPMRRTTPAATHIAGRVESRVADRESESKAAGGWKLRWVAALLVAGLVAAVAIQSRASRSPGQLVYATGPVEIQQREATLSTAGLTELALDRGALLQTGADQRATFFLGRDEDVYGAVDVNSSLRFASARELVLDRGAVWLEVKHAGKGFEVRTPQGVVRVTGTIFGVRVEEDQVEVEVARGSVEVAKPDSSENRKVEIGQQLTLARGRFSPVAARESATANPQWATDVRDEFVDKKTGGYTPSLKVRQ